MIWEYMLDGMRAGAWTLGLLLVLSIAACVLATICLLFMAAFGDDEEEGTNENATDKAGRARARGVAAGVEPPVRGDRRPLRDRRGADPRG